MVLSDKQFTPYGGFFSMIREHIFSQILSVKVKGFENWVGKWTFVDAAFSTDKPILHFFMQK